MKKALNTFTNMLVGAAVFALFLAGSLYLLGNFGNGITVIEFIVCLILSFAMTGITLMIIDINGQAADNLCENGDFSEHKRIIFEEEYFAPVVEEEKLSPTAMYQNPGDAEAIASTFTYEFSMND